MTTFTNSPHILKGGLVLIDPEADQVLVHYLPAIQPGVAHPHLAGPNSGRER